MENNDRVSKQTLIAVVIGTVIATVTALEVAGKLEHTTDKEAMPLAEYKVVLLQEGKEHRLSSKPADQYAYCHEGFLFIQSETDPMLKGPMVDFKNRGIPCGPTSGAEVQPEDCDQIPWYIKPPHCR